MDTICIRCPMGCHLHVQKIGDKVVVTGNTCPRGAEYGQQEFTLPRRTITTVKATKKGTICLKTDKAVDKKLYFDVLKAVKDAPIKNKYKLGEVIIKNVCGTSSNIIVTSINE